MIWKMNRRDLAWSLALAVGSGLIGVLVLRSGVIPYFYQFFMPETVYLACRGSFGHPGALQGPLQDFLTLRATSFDCADLPPAVSDGRLGVFPQEHLYLALAVGWLWRIFSPSVMALLPLVAAFYATYVVGCFALLRHFFSRPPALFGAVLLMLSPSALSVLPYLRDFSKAPFIVWGVVLLIAAGRAEGLHRQLVLASLAGLTTGVGFGFRSDVAVLLLLAILFLGLGMHRGLAGRAAAIATFFLVFAFAAWPMLSTGKSGNLGAMALEGASDPFNTYLGLRSAPYSWGVRYSDELTLSAIAADLRPQTLGWDRNEAQPVHGVSQSITRSTDYLLRHMDLVGADFAARAIKSAALLLAYPSLVEPERVALDPGGYPVPGNSVASWLSGAYALVGRIWTIPLGVLGFAAFLLREYTLRPRQALVLALGLGALLGYPALQFSMRHAFHLEFAWVLALLGLFHVACDARAYASRLPKFLLGSALACALVGLVYLGLATYQDRAMERAFKTLLAGEVESVAGPMTLADGTATLTVPVPPEHRSLVMAPADSMVGKALPISPQWDVRAEVDRLLLTVGGPDCHDENIDVSLNYEKRDEWQPLDQVIKVHRSSSDLGPTKVLFPAFYRPTQHFSGLSVPAEAEACVLGVERLLAPTRLPAAISAVLPPDWSQMPLHLEL